MSAQHQPELYAPLYRELPQKGASNDHTARLHSDAQEERQMVEQQALIDAIEGSIFTLPEIPGVITVPSIPGVAVMHGLIPSPELNCAGKARLTAETVDAAITEVKTVFRAAGKVCGWWVTPNSRPEEIADHLKRAGFALIAEGAGMVLTDLGAPITTNPAVRVEQIGSEDIVGIEPMMARSYGMPEEAAAVMAQFLSGLLQHVDASLYLAFVADGKGPVAWSASLYLPGVPVVVLQGAATLPEQRGQGIYSTMVARRLEDARERGVEAAVIQANRATSAPIAEKLGFREVMPLTLYAWDPATSG